MSDKGKGGGKCLLIGCVTVVVIAIALVVAAFVGIQWLKSQAASYLADEPADLAVITPSEEEIAAVKGKFETAFVELLDGKATELVITARDLNVMVASQPDTTNLQGRVYFDITNNVFVVKVSIPLEEMDADLFSGKWLNGEAHVSLAVSGNRLEAYVQDIRANGKSLPEFFMSQLRAANMLENNQQEIPPEMREILDRIESVETKESCLILRTVEGTDYLAEAPLDIPPPVLPEGPKQALYGRLATFNAAAEAGKQAELTLDRNDLNLLIDALELGVTNVAARPLIEADITQGSIRLRGSAPLAASGLTSLTNKFLNGDSLLRLSVTDGRLAGRLSSTRVNDNPLPSFLRQLESDADLFSQAEEEGETDPEVRDLLESVTDVRIQDGRLILVTGTPAVRTTNAVSNATAPVEESTP